MPGSPLCNPERLQEKHKENPPQIPTDYTNSGHNSPKRTYSFPALQPAHLWSTEPSFPSTFAPNPLPLSPLCPHPQRPPTDFPAPKSPPAHLDYLWPTRALFLPPVPFSLPIPAQQLLQTCPAPSSPSACVTAHSPFPLPQKFHLVFPSQHLLFGALSQSCSAQPPPEQTSPLIQEGLLLFPSSPFLGISFNSKSPPSGYVLARLLPPSISLSLHLLSLGRGAVKASLISSFYFSLSLLPSPLCSAAPAPPQDPGAPWLFPSGGRDRPSPPLLGWEHTCPNIPSSLTSAPRPGRRKCSLASTPHLGADSKHREDKVPSWIPAPQICSSPPAPILPSSHGVGRAHKQFLPREATPRQGRSRAARRRDVLYLLPPCFDRLRPRVPQSHPRARCLALGVRGIHGARNPSAHPLLAQPAANASHSEIHQRMWKSSQFPNASVRSPLATALRPNSSSCPNRVVWGHFPAFNSKRRRTARCVWPPLGSTLILHTCLSPRRMYRSTNREHAEISHCRQPEGWNHPVLISLPRSHPPSSAHPAALHGISPILRAKQEEQCLIH